MNQGTLKRCTKCGVEKPHTREFFGLEKRRPCGFQARCRACVAQDSRATRAQVRTLINSLKDYPCTDCGVKYPPYVMQFDHVKGVKKFTIGKCGGGGGPAERQAGLKPTTNTEAILEEAAKCQIVCANCHSIRTYTRRILSGEEEA